jgi:hypothetical protein
MEVGHTRAPRRALARSSNAPQPRARPEAKHDSRHTSTRPAGRGPSMITAITETPGTARGEVRRRAATRRARAHAGRSGTPRGATGRAET